MEGNHWLKALVKGYNDRTKERCLPSLFSLLSTVLFQPQIGFSFNLNLSFQLKAAVQLLAGETYLITFSRNKRLFFLVHLLEKQSHIFPRSLQKASTQFAFALCYGSNGMRQAASQKYSWTRGTYDWGTVSKMKNEGVQSNPIWPTSASGRLFAFALGDEIHPGFCYGNREDQRSLRTGKILLLRSFRARCYLKVRENDELTY